MGDTHPEAGQTARMHMAKEKQKGGAKEPKSTGPIQVDGSILPPVEEVDRTLQEYTAARERGDTPVEEPNEYARRILALAVTASTRDLISVKTMNQYVRVCQRDRLQREERERQRRRSAGR